MINGVTITGNGSAVPLITALPGYGLVGLRGAFSFGERSEVFIDFEHIADKQYRGISWGIDGAGRGAARRDVALPLQILISASARFPLQPDRPPSTSFL